MKRVKIEYIPLDSFTDLVINYDRETAHIEKKHLPEDIAVCVTNLRKEYGGHYLTSVEFEEGTAVYEEPVNVRDYYTLLGQLEDISRAISICKKKLRKVRKI